MIKPMNAQLRYHKFLLYPFVRFLISFVYLNEFGSIPTC